MLGEMGSDFLPAPIDFKFNRNDSDNTIKRLNLPSRSSEVKGQWVQIFKML